MRKWPEAVFLDRDGVVMPETGAYIVQTDQVRLLPRADEAIRRLNTAAIPVIVVTNQAGVARGALTHEMLTAIHGELDRQLAAAGAYVDAIYACEHQDGDGCTCRKPLPGLLRRAAEKASVDLTNCVMIGDSPRDIVAGEAAGCATVLIPPANGGAAEYTAIPGHIYPSLMDAVEALLDGPAQPQS